MSVRLFGRFTVRNLIRQFSSSVGRPNLFPFANAVKILSSASVVQNLQQKRFARVEVDWPEEKPKPTKKQVDERVFKAIKTFDRLPKDKELTMETHFANDLGLDSLDHVEILMAIEQEFEIEIPDDDYDKLLTVRSIVEYVYGKIDLAPPAPA